jgi:hypothetical protein
MSYFHLGADMDAHSGSDGPLTISVVTDEPGRLIVMGEVRNAVLRNGSLYANYEYYGQKNKGPWVALEPYGTRIPAEW